MFVFDFHWDRRTSVPAPCAQARARACLPVYPSLPLSSLFLSLPLTEVDNCAEFDRAVAAANLTAAAEHLQHTHARTRTSTRTHAHALILPGIPNMLHRLSHQHMQHVWSQTRFHCDISRLVPLFRCISKNIKMNNLDVAFVLVFQWLKRDSGSAACPTSAGPCCSRPYITCWKGKTDLFTH